jgi:prepilin-type N-terminal cleavage/methylation domain-containing protein
MTVRRSRSVYRTGFTLVELLIVISIISVLVTLLLAAVMKTLEKGPQIQTRVEIGQMESAVQSVVQTYKLKFVPSQIMLCENWSDYGTNASVQGTLEYNSVQFLQRMFPRLNPTAPPLGYIDWNRNGQKDAKVTLQGPECLVFFLGGPGNRGFSADPANPANTVSIQPQAFEFKPSRLVASSVAPGYFVYYNNYGMPPAGKAQPYLYFTSYYQGNDYVATDCSSYNVTPYVDPNTGRFINPNGYQIVSAGVKGVFAPGGSTSWDPIKGALVAAAQDNQSNFAPGLMRAGQ